MGGKEKIKELKKELAQYNKKDKKRLKVIKDQQKIADLKKQIRAKKYGGLIQVSKNLKGMGKRLFRPIPGSPALFGEVGKDLSKPKNRLSNLQIENIRDKRKKGKFIF
tara:strand:+ start:238 stop:561 length:324 start_codon:yes stop_codon:yes gene_type:complete